MSDSDGILDVPHRTSDPLRVFLHSDSAERNGSHFYRFYVNLDAHFDSYDIYFQIRKIQCTYSFYQINSTNNRLDLNGGSYTVPSGNYSASELVDKLNNVGGSQREWNGLPIHFSYDANRGKITIYNSDTAFSWGTATTLYTVLGFSSIPSGTQNSFTSTQLVDVSPIKVLNFHLVSVPSQSFALYSSNEISRYLCSLFVGDREPFTVLETDDETRFQETTLQHAVRSLEFTIYDQRGIPVDLQNGSFQIMLEFSFQPKKVWRLFYQ